MKSDGHSEVYAYTPADASMSFGALIKGTRWHRGEDSVGIGYAKNWLSRAHVNYLNLGGVDGFIGDGRISYKPEQASEVYYNIGTSRFFWFTLDYQRIFNPAYNSDRGPVNVMAIRLHAVL